MQLRKIILKGWLKMQDMKLTDQFSRNLQGMKLQDVKYNSKHSKKFRKTDSLKYSDWS